MGKGVAAPCGSSSNGRGLSKTVTFAHLIARYLQRNESRVVVLVHRDELAKQAQEKLVSVVPDLEVGIVKAESNDIDASVVVASVQTLFNPARREQLRDVGLVVVDECFPAGTRVGDKNIEDLKPGDLVPSWNEDTGREELRPVKRVMKKTPTSMVRVHFSDGTHLDCTPNHPILTEDGWSCAGMLHSGASVVSFAYEEEARSTLRELRGSDNSRRSQEDRLLEKIPASLLLDRVSGCSPESRALGEDVPNEPGARFGPHASEEPDAPTRVTREDVPNVEGDGSPSQGQGWERHADTGTTTDPYRSVPRVGVGVHLPSRGRGASVSLQAGHSESRTKGERGGGWGVPLLTGAPTLRPAQGREVVERRVDRVQVLEPGRDGTYAGVCPDGYVYNLEVEETHTYLVNDGIVVHNCHHYAAPAYREVLEELGLFDGSVLGVGFTATMNRSDSYGLGDIWEDVVYEKDILWGIANGFLVDVRAESVTVDDLNLAEIARNHGDYQEGKLGEALIASGAAGVVARAYQEKAGSRQGIAFCPTVESAVDLNTELLRVGIEARVVIGATPIPDRQLLYEAYRQGRIQVLVSVMALTEGFDMPQAEVAVVYRPARSASLRIQMIGRVLRPFPGKDEALVLDVVGAVSGGSLVGLTDLSRTEVVPKEGESLAEALARSEDESQNVERDVIAGKATYATVNLFKGSDAAWLRTHGGTWFIPTKKCLVVLKPQEDGKFRVARTHSNYRARGEDAAWLTDRAMSLELAIAWGEQLAIEIDPVVADRSRDWRKNRRTPTKQQKDHATRLGLSFHPKIRKNELSDLISVHYASRMLDPKKK